MELSQHKARNENNTVTCLTKLKLQGYHILVADPDADGVSIFDIDITRHKVALLFGNELRGISREAVAYCDQKVKIPMYGFTESLNISVSVAVCLTTLVEKMHATGVDPGLSPNEKDAIRLNWYRKIVRKSSVIEREFLRIIE
jgi:tRNA (guanosine-2'-O-)-methyltransferase